MQEVWRRLREVHSGTDAQALMIESYPCAKSIEQDLQGPTDMGVPIASLV